MCVRAGWETALETHANHVRVNFHGPLPFPKMERYMIVTQASVWVMLNTVNKIFVCPLSCMLEIHALMVIQNAIDAAPGGSGVEFTMVMNNVLEHLLVSANSVPNAGCGRVVPPSSL
jgi:hypothetical protein